jgi:hypothetical protein
VKAIVTGPAAGFGVTRSRPLTSGPGSGGTSTAFVASNPARNECGVSARDWKLPAATMLVAF